MHRIVVSVPAWMRGGPRPRHVAVAVVLGALVGATVGWNLTFVLLVTLALLHHGPLLVTVVAGLIACIAALIGSNLTTAIGSFCCEKIGLGGVIEWFGHGPLVALLGWHEYELIGGALLALVLSLPAAHALARRRSTTSEDEAESDLVPRVRPWGYATATVWLLAAAATLHIAVPQRVGGVLLKYLSAAVGAPVTADGVRYDLFGGRLELDGVRVCDLDEPGRIALRIDSVVAAVEPGLLLRGRLQAERVELAGLTYDLDPAASAPPKLFRSEPSTAAGEAGRIVDARTGDPTQPVEAAGLLRNGNELAARISALGRLIAAVENTADLEISHAAVARRVQAVRRPALDPRDATGGRSLPLVQIKQLHLVGFPAGWSLGDEARVTLANLTSRPATTPRGVQLTCVVPRGRLQLTIDFRLSTGERRHEVTLTCDGVPAGDLVDLRRAAEVGIEAAANPTLALRGRGSAGRDRLELALACDVAGLRPTATAPRFGNLDPAVWQAGIERLGGLRLDATLNGRWHDPHLLLTPVAVVDQLKHQLRSAGEHALVKAVEAGRFAPPVAAPPVAVSPTIVPSLAVTPPVGSAPAAPLAASTEKKPDATAPAAAKSPTLGSVVPAPTPDAAPSGVAQAAAIVGLRQPASVLDPSSLPGRTVAAIGDIESFTAAVARTRPAPVAPPAEPLVVSSSSAGREEATAVIRDDARKLREPPPQTSLVDKWFGATDAVEKPKPSIAVNPNPPIVVPYSVEPLPSEPEQKTAKQWFPRIRKLRGKDGKSSDPPPEAIVESPPPTDDERRPPSVQPLEVPAPQTAKTPWYERIFR